jgi:hypothetical protein
MNDLNIEEYIILSNEEILQIHNLLFDYIKKINYDHNINIKLDVENIKKVVKDMLFATNKIVNIIGGSNNNDDIINNINNINNVITEIYNYISNNNNNISYDPIENITNILDKNDEIERIFEIYK